MSRVQVTRLLVVVSLLALLLVQLLLSWQQRAPWVVWLLRWLPLLVLVPGLCADRLRSFLWLCLVCLLYILASVLRLFSFPGDLPAVGTLLASTTLLFSAMFYARWRSRELHRGATDDRASA